MKIHKLIPSIILATSFSTIFIFGMVFYLFSGQTTPQINTLIKESLTITSSFFGGMATLIAAYVAANLFNDWRDQHNKSITNQFSLDAYKTYSELDQSLMNCALKIDNLNNLILDFEYPILLNSHKYNECLPSTNKIIEDFNLIKMHFTNCFDKIRAYAAVTGNTDESKRKLINYTNLFTEINNINISKYESIQDFIQIANTQMKKISDLSNLIYETSVKEMLESLKV